MAHREWCGKACCDCKHPCSLDMSMICSPDCENLSEDGEPNPVRCADCVAYAEYKDMFGEEEA